MPYPLPLLERSASKTYKDRKRFTGRNAVGIYQYKSPSVVVTQTNFLSMSSKYFDFRTTMNSDAWVTSFVMPRSFQQFL